MALPVAAQQTPSTGNQDELAAQFERARVHLRSVAFRMLGSADAAQDAVQEAWLRASRADASAIQSVPAWLTTIVARVCLETLRARRRRREEPLDRADLARIPSRRAAESDPERQSAWAESVGLALLVVLDRLGPGERVAFVLHDLFSVPFEQIAPIVERTPAAAKKLASRARRRVQGTPRASRADLAKQQQVIEAFLRAVRARDVDALIAVLAPDIVRRADRVAQPLEAAREIRGARRVAEETVTNAGRARFARPALVDGRIGVVVAPRGRLRFVLDVTVAGDRVAAFEVIGEPGRLAKLELAVLSRAI